jgi:glycosyltransferase involved in cell wall biosynthesis
VLKENGIDAIIVLDKKIRGNYEWLNCAKNIEPYYFKLFEMVNENRKLSNLKIFIKSIWKNAISYLFQSKDKFWVNKQEDILIVPEIWICDFSKFRLNNSVIIFNQNCFYTVHNFCDISNLLGIVTVSNYSKEYLDIMYPNYLVHKISVGIDTSLFQYKTKKKKIISYMSRKRPDDVKQLLMLLNFNKQIEDWEFIDINNISEFCVANTLKESMVFLSFSDQEGLGLPPLEAMSCGCIVIGYDGGGGKEFFNPNININVNSGDILSYYNCINDVLINLNNDFEYYDKMRMAAREFIVEHYNLKKEQDSILNVWTKFIN